jgi:RING-H2 zinc finger domain
MNDDEPFTIDATYLSKKAIIFLFHLFLSTAGNVVIASETKYEIRSAFTFFLYVTYILHLPYTLCCLLLYKRYILHMHREFQTRRGFEVWAMSHTIYTVRRVVYVFYCSAKVVTTLIFFSNAEYLANKDGLMIIAYPIVILTVVQFMVLVGMGVLYLVYVYSIVIYDVARENITMLSGRSRVPATRRVPMRERPSSVVTVREIHESGTMITRPDRVIVMIHVDKSNNEVRDDDICPICLSNEYDVNANAQVGNHVERDTLYYKQWVELACSHRFHNACIQQWIEQSSTCPICRQ